MFSFIWGHAPDLDKELNMGNWIIETIEDAYKERPPVRYAVNGLIEIPSVNILYGPPSALKSMLLLDLTMNVVKGDSWLKNEDGIPAKLTEKNAVLWVDFDNGKRRTRDRVKATGKHYGRARDDLFFYVSMPPGGLDMGEITSAGELEDAIKDCLPSGGVVVIDNLGCVIGKADENSHSMANILASFRTFAERYSVAFVIIHHQRKGNGMPGRAGDSLRGHSSIEAALDLALLVERDEGSNRVSIKATKVRGFEVTPFSAHFRYLGDAAELREAWFTGVDSDGIERRTEKAILKHLVNGPKNKQSVRDFCKKETNAGEKRADDALDRVIKADLVEEKRGQGKELLYSLKNMPQLEILYSPGIEPSAS
jgi:hypothetical protein